MIRLVKLRMKNFKSFKQSTIPFSNGFTVIAGANGSGKSNIMDAVLFALGETSLKSLRAARLTDLVHNVGNTDGYAVVNLTLEGNNQIYEISRTIDKQGKSVYRLNEKRVTLSEIHNLLSELGLRVDGHNLVSQGDLLRFIDMNPVERRGMIDEVAGLQEFEEKKGEAMKDLEKVDRKIKDVTIVLNERMAVIEQLGKEREVAKRFKQMEQELQQTKATILHIESHDLNKKIEGLLSNQMELIEKKDESMKKQQEARAQILDMEKEFQELDQQVVGVKNKAFESLGKSVEEHKAEIRVLEERVAFSRKHVEQLLAQIESLLQVQREAVSEQQKLDAKRSEWESNLVKVEEEISPIQKKQREALQKKVEILEKTQKAERELEEARDIVTRTREKIASLHSQMESIRREEESRATFHQRLTAQKARLAEEKKELSKDEEKRAAIHKKYPDFAAAKKKLQEKITQINEHAAESSGKAFASREAIHHLQKAKSECPVCSRELTPALKTKLLEKNNEGIHAHEKASATVEAERAKMQKEWNELIEAEAQYSHLSASQARLETLEKEEKTIHQELAALEKEKKEHSLPALRAEKQTAEEALVDQKKEMDKHEMALSKLRDALNQTTMDQQLNKMGEEKTRIEKEIMGIQFQKSMKQSAVDQAAQRIEHLEKEAKVTNQTIAGEEKRRNQLQKALKESESLYEKELGANQALLQKREKVQQKLSVERERERTWQEKTYRVEGQLTEIKIEQSKWETRLQDVKEELRNFEGVKTVDETNLVELRKRVPVLEHTIKQLGTVNMKSLEDFGQYEKDVLDIRQKANVLDEERLAVLDLIQSIDLKRNEAFMKTFHSINENFNRIYTTFFNGSAKLELSIPDKPLESGLLIEARHGEEKSLKNIDSMSGGEKSLTSLAFIFAIQLFEPAPFYFFDEVDAALDMNNSRKVGVLIHEMSRSSQFISISHNDSVVKAADQIIGVAKTNTSSSVIGIKNPEEQALSS